MLTQHPLTVNKSQPKWVQSAHVSHTQTAVKALATGYCLTGRRTSTDKLVYPGCVALSDSLRRKLGAKYGDRIEVEGIGQFTFDDRSPQRFRHIDIHFPRYRDAKRFGAKRVLVWRVKG